MAFQLEGTKIQLASNGSSWIHEGVETNPFLSTPYKQYSHFAQEDVSLTRYGRIESSDDEGTSGSNDYVLDTGSSEYVLDTKADILLNLFFEIQVDSTPKDQPWSAEYLIEEIRIFSGETLIDYYNKDYQRAYYNFMLNSDKKALWDKMTSSTGTASSYLYLPLIFGFCQNDDQTLPHVALINKNIRIEVKWGYLLTSRFNTKNVTLYGKVAFLQGRELNNVKYTNDYILLKTLDTDKTTISGSMTTKLNEDIYMKRMVRDIFWYLDYQDTGYGFNWPKTIESDETISDIMTSIPNSNAYTQPHLSAGVVRMLPEYNISQGKMETGKFVLDKKTLFPLQKEKFFNLMQAYWRYSGCPQPGYYAYSWSLYPEKTQPSGSLNTSLFNEIQLDMSLYEPSSALSLSWFSSMSTIIKKANGGLMPISKD